MRRSTKPTERSQWEATNGHQRGTQIVERQPAEPPRKHRSDEEEEEKEEEEANLSRCSDVESTRSIGRIDSTSDSKNESVGRANGSRESRNDQTI